MLNKHCEEIRYYYDDYILLKNKKTAAIKIELSYTYIKKNEHIWVWSVAFGISNKKKHIKQWFNGETDRLTNNITGEGDLEGLIWAKNKLIEFETQSSLPNICTHRVIVEWDDNRRRNVYNKYLTKKLGYKMTRYEGGKCLLKDIQK